jgi:hypothetical protein
MDSTLTEGRMSKAFRFQTTGFRIALIALAIQGVSPDADDLTSFSLARILLSIVADSISPVDDSAPLGGEKPDEVFVPAAARMRLLLRRLVGTLRIRGLITALAGVRACQPDLLRPRAARWQLRSRKREDPLFVPPYLLTFPPRRRDVDSLQSGTSGLSSHESIAGVLDRIHSGRATFSFVTTSKDIRSV